MAMPKPEAVGGEDPKPRDVRVIDIQVPAQFMDMPDAPTAPLKTHGQPR